MNKKAKQNFSSDSAIIKQIGSFGVSGKRKNPNQNRVYDQSGISPCINCCGGGGLQPYIIEQKELNN